MAGACANARPGVRLTPVYGLRRLCATGPAVRCRAAQLPASAPAYSPPDVTYFKGESASSGSSFVRCSFVLSIIQGMGANE